MPRKTKVALVDIPEDPSEGPEPDFCIGCGELKVLDLNTGLCTDCEYAEDEEMW